MNLTCSGLLIIANLSGITLRPVQPAKPTQTVPSAEKATAANSMVVVWRDRPSKRTYQLPQSIGGKPASFYLNNPKVSPLAKALYTARFRPTDNDSTARLLALVTTNDNSIRPFYRWCLDFTITISDGALGEYPGVPALAYATKFPQEFFAYMDKDASGQRYKRWVEIIAYSGLSNYNEAKPLIRKGIIEDMTKKCQPCSAATNQRINRFAKSVVDATKRHQ